ncbi:DMT family transporter [Microlunatus parietis]|uniref:Multidrug transporter EmrE-like cation transporter n=1 Tax=Microlunatus parietis TaxID=682979 RepID=A0A7Y9LB87_9ACTN|nr:SMR family transporter [Microlunatus parietis]NYE73634.1 multidrug transporter EmrE-like cation transporter [Microlunatus parietis]
MAEAGRHRSAGKDRRPTRRGIQAWTALFLAIALDVVQVFALDASAGFTHPLLATAAILAFVAELVLFTLALRLVPPTNAYALLGLSTAAVSVISIGWLGEQITIIKALALLAVIAGSVLLNGDARAASAGSPRRTSPGSPGAKA